MVPWVSGGAQKRPLLAIFGPIWPLVIRPPKSKVRTKSKFGPILTQNCSFGGRKLSFQGPTRPKAGDLNTEKSWPKIEGHLKNYNKSGGHICSSNLGTTRLTKVYILNMLEIIGEWVIIKLYRSVIHLAAKLSKAFSCSMNPAVRGEIF